MLITIIARRDPTLAARVLRSTSLLYADGADAALDRPAHVRSASGLVWAGERVAIIQDDANFIALADPRTGVSGALALPAGEGGLRQFDDVRGNKRFKLDLECCIRLEDADGGETMIGFGSGSTLARDRIVIVRGVAADAPGVRVVDAGALYAALRAETAFAGSEMNIEGAAVIGGTLRLFNRGNGAPHGDLVPVNATAEVELAAFLAYLDDPASTPPRIGAIARYELGAIGAFPLTFTDAVARGGAILYAAAAEGSPDATRDGPVAGCAIGILRDGVGRYAEVRNADGTLYPGKIEGILPRGDDPSRLWAVIDRDDPAAPSEILEIVLEGNWA